MSAQQRKLQDIQIKQGLSKFHRSSKNLLPIQKSLKTQPNLHISPPVDRYTKLSRVTSVYKSPQKDVKITNKRTSIQRVSISQQLKNLVKLTSQLQLDGLDGVKNILKNSDTVTTSLQRAQNVDVFLVGLADGHGPQGQEMSQMITHQVMNEMNNLINSTPIIGLSLMINQSFQKIFQEVEQNMLEQTNIDVKSNGSSMLSLVIINNMIYCANLGDSKAAYFYKKDINPIGHLEFRKFAQKNLNLVHDTNNSKEVQRILNRGGKIDQALYRGYKSGSLKVWVPKQNYPGVKITRCFGNTIGKMVGISAEPEITEFKVPKSGFLMIGTTGFWEKMDILTIDQILDAHYPPTGQEDLDQVLQEIGDEMKKYWDPSSEGLIDISLVLIFIDIN